MASTHSRRIFVNLPVRDLKKSMDDGHHWEVLWMDPAVHPGSGRGRGNRSVAALFRGHQGLPAC